MSSSKKAKPKVVVAELHSDEAWKLIQQNTFTRWVNQKLKVVDVVIIDLGNDFNDGLKLIRLVEVLSGKPISKANKKATFRSQKLENISLALDFLQKEEHIKIINIDSAAIADGNLKLILGLVWTLILHYSISKQVWVDEFAGGDAQGHLPERTPKQKLMQWIKYKIPPRLPCNNFTTDWNDGILLGSLVDSCAPTVELKWQHWKPSEALHTTREAMDVATTHLDVAPLITAEELVNPSVDEKSVMTYLAQFPQCRYERPTEYVDDGDVKKDLLIDRSPPVGFVSMFRLRLADPLHDPEVRMTDPEGKQLEARLVRISPKCYYVSYTPRIVGQHKVVVSERDLAKGESHGIVSETVEVVEGPQVEYPADGIQIGKPVVFEVHNAPNEHHLKVNIIDPEGKEQSLSQSTTGKWSFVPMLKGEHFVNVYYKNRFVNGSPFAVIAAPREGLSVSGPGITSQSVKAGERAVLYVHLPDDYTLPLTVTVHRKADDKSIAVEELDDAAENRRSFAYRPLVGGKHTVTVASGDRALTYDLTVEDATKEENECAAIALGDGLERAICGLPAVFFVQYDDDEGTPDPSMLNVKLEGGSSCEITGTPMSEDGVFAIIYRPVEPGDYVLSLTYRGVPIKGSPFKVKCTAAEDHPSSLKQIVCADIHQAQLAKPNEEVLLGVELPGAREEDVTARLKDPFGESEDIDVWRTTEGHYEVKFKPRVEGLHLISLLHRGQHTNGSPMPFRVGERVGGGADYVRLLGVVPLTGEADTDRPFTVYTREAGEGKLTVSLDGAENSELKFIDQKDGNCHFTCKVPSPGAYVISVLFNDDPIRDSPFEVLVTPKYNKAIRLELLDFPKEGKPDEACMFTVLTHGTSAHVEGKVRTPSNVCEDANVIPVIDRERYALCFLPHEKGNYYVDVTADGSPMPGSPFHMRVGESDFGQGDELGVGESHGVQGDELGVGEIHGVQGDKLGVGESHVVHGDELGVGESHVVHGDEFGVGESHGVQGDKLGVGESHGVHGDELGVGEIHGVHGDELGVGEIHGVQGEELGVGEIHGVHGDELGVGEIHGVQGEELGVVESDAVKEDELGLGKSVEGDLKTAVTVEGDGIRCGVVGDECKFLINVDRAGSGTLFVYVDGPSKLDYYVDRVETGYEVRYTPTVAGVYKASIKYSGAHIPGSPFSIAVEEKARAESGDSICGVFEVIDDAVAEKEVIQKLAYSGDADKEVVQKFVFSGEADKVVVKGEGLSKFVPDEPTVFEVETDLAGPNVLFVGIFTSEGPCEQFTVKHTGGGKYHVEYLIHSKANGFIYISYGNKLVPGSPFIVSA